MQTIGRFVPVGVPPTPLSAGVPPTMDAVCGRLRAWRLARRLGVRQWAAAAGVGVATVSALCHGRPVSTRIIERLEMTVDARFEGYAPAAAGRISRLITENGGDEDGGVSP